ncbi:MAG: hypothetical protein GEU82_14375 [Luteitalea sp.]|nr:hypothetical protein [Luteitalea sp.]
MKHVALIILGLAMASMAAVAQGRAAGAAAEPPPLAPGASQADVDKALLAAPANLKNQATVIKWKPDFTYDVLRKGTNRLVCYDRSGFPLQQPVSVQCTSIGNLEREAQNLRAEAVGDRKKSEAMLSEMEKNGTRMKPAYGSLWYVVSGPDLQRLRPHHLTIAVPGATKESTGLPENPREGGAWIMDAGTSTAHIMVPGN